MLNYRYLQCKIVVNNNAKLSFINIGKLSLLTMLNLSSTDNTKIIVTNNAKLLLLVMLNYR